MRPLTLEDIAQRMDALAREVAHVIRTLEETPERAYARVDEPITVTAREAARILGVKRDQVYEYHHAGRLNGFRYEPSSHLRFLLSDVRAFAVELAAKRVNA